MKLLLITNIFPNPQDPLRGVFVYNISQKLKEMCELSVISPLPWVPKVLRVLNRYKRFMSVPGLFEIGGLKVISPKYFAFPKLGTIHPIFMFISLLPNIYRFKKNKSVSVINAQCIFPDGIAVCWVARLLKLPLVLSALGTDVNLYSKYIFRRPQIVNALKWATKITVVSEAQKKLIHALGINENKIVVIKNGVDAGRFNIKDKEGCRDILKIEKNLKIVLFVGRIEEIKGITYLIDAFGKLVKAGRDYRLLVIGGGNQITQYKKKVSKMKLDGHISFIGEKSQDELPLWYGACDMFCLPSIMEGCPNVILEALASGRPVVASKVGGIPEIVNKKNGILFNVGNTEQLADALKITMETEKNEHEIRDSVKNYTWENTAKKYLSVCYDALQEKTDKIGIT